MIQKNWNQSVTHFSSLFVLLSIPSHDQVTQVIPERIFCRQEQGSRARAELTSWPEAAWPSFLIQLFLDPIPETLRSTLYLGVVTARFTSFSFTFSETRNTGTTSWCRFCSSVVLLLFRVAQINQYCGLGVNIWDVTLKLTSTLWSIWE